MEQKELSPELAPALATGEAKDLTLVIKEMTIGNLVTNATEIKAFVAEKLKEYSVEHYGHDAKQAAKDKAELNAAAKKLNDERIALEKQWNKPFQEFKDIVSETTAMIKEASGKLDGIVKAKEAAEKAEKKEAIVNVWDAKNFTLVPLVQIFNPQWLNKTYKIAKVEADIDNLIQKISDDLSALEGFGEDTRTLKELYLTTLDLQDALKKGAELKANRERLAALEAERKAQEERKAQAARCEFSRGNSEGKGANSQDAEEVRNAQAAEPLAVTPPENEREAVESASAEPESEQEAERPLGVPPIPTEKQYTFHIVGEAEDIETVRRIASEMRLSSPPSLTLCATDAEIEAFKARLMDNMLGYKKVGNPSLYVEYMLF